MRTSVFSPSRIIAARDGQTLLQRTSQLRSDVLDLLEAASAERCGGSADLVGRLQQVANDLGAAERMLLVEAQENVAVD